MRKYRKKCLITSLFLLFISTSILLISLDSFFSKDSSRHELQKRKTFLLVLITSSVQHSNKRRAIRNSWLKLHSPLSKHFFVVGGKNSADEEATLQAESFEYGDILILPSTNDDYSALAEKVLRAFVHFSHTWTFEFLLKCDDDSFVQVPDIVHELITRFAKTRNLYWGFFNGNARVKKTGPWRETKWILCDRYLPYALGGGYVLSSSMVHFIARNHRDLNIYRTEDVSVGTWLAPVNVTRIHDPRFDTEYLTRGCSNTYLVTHKRTEADMLFFYNNIVNTGKLCDVEFKLRASYLYDWDVEPSKCCRRINASVP